MRGAALAIACGLGCWFATAPVAAQQQSADASADAPRSSEFCTRIAQYALGTPAGGKRWLMVGLHGDGAGGNYCGKIQGDVDGAALCGWLRTNLASMYHMQANIAQAMQCFVPDPNLTAETFDVDEWQGSITVHDFPDRAAGLKVQFKYSYNAMTPFEQARYEITVTRPAAPVSP